MAHTPNKEVVITATHVKQVKTRVLIIELETLTREDRVTHKRLECIKGFLIYVVRNFKWMTPYLKGLHLTIDGWREGFEKYFYKTKS